MCVTGSNPVGGTNKKGVYNMNYVQCQLRKGNKIDVSWIEEKFAVVGKQIKRKNESTDSWDDGWIVDKTFGKVNEEHVKKMRDLYKHHRKGTDI